MLAAAQRKLDMARGVFQTSADILVRYAVPFGEAETLCRWGSALGEAGERVRAEEKFESAIAIYRRISAGQRWLNRVENERARHTLISVIDWKFGYSRLDACDGSDLKVAFARTLRVAAARRIAFEPPQFVADGFETLVKLSSFDLHSGPA